MSKEIKKREAARKKQKELFQEIIKIGREVTLKQDVEYKPDNHDPMIVASFALHASEFDNDFMYELAIEVLEAINYKDEVEYLRERTEIS